ncbi:neuronal acetylcholine receptor subunit alpha-10 isoform X3 [Pocillopora verrucosa]|uniref:neuronal acetylcholine receptor subunit alpha-10 isoform X3 n=1 Tax=Pocillopora verrucosa TaxID=203993 RepID=UPI002797877F|nr:neuronal acetylcholine receptor subunit alpha-10-like isoform X3 [Pocillopora verrucosa]
MVIPKSFISLYPILIILGKGLSEQAFNASVNESHPIISDELEVDDDEARLVKDLFKGYNETVRPTEDKQLPIEVKFGIAYTQIVDLIEKDQVLVSNIWVRMAWNNHLLKWNASEYGGIKTINLSPHKVWLPDIVLHNNAEELLPSGTLYLFKTKVILTSDGSCTWYAPTILRSSCNIDITYFPFDDQICELKFGSWTYHGLEVNIVQMRDTADLNFYMKSSEFELISAKAKRNVAKYSCCPEPYPDVTFFLHLRRKPGFFLYNIIIPCLVITSLAVLTFVLPPEIGERVTLIGGALIANCISLNLYRKYRMPQWVRVVFLHYLARCLCINSGQPKDKIEKRSHLVKGRPAELTVLEDRKLSGTKPLGSPGGHSLKSPTHHHTALFRSTQDLPSKVTDGLAELAQSEINHEEHRANRQFWIFVSRVVDRVFLLIFSIAFVCSSCAIFAQVPDHYNLLL